MSIQIDGNVDVGVRQQGSMRSDCDVGENLYCNLAAKYPN